MTRRRTLNSTTRRVIVTFVSLIAFATFPAKASTPLFLPAVTYNSGGNGAMSVAVGDVNGDDRPDVVVVNACPITGCSDREALAVLLANGDGSFQDAVTYGSGGVTTSTNGSSSGTASVAIAAVNKDAKADLLVTNPCGTGGECTSGSVGVLLGNGDGTFQAAMTYGSGGYIVTSVAVADMNHDGNPDLVVANTCADNLCGLGEGDGLVGVLFGNGDGAFQAALIYGSGGRFAQSAAVADVNGDDRLDILAANESGSIGALLGNGDGTFQPAVAYESLGSHRFIVIADVNGDGSPDIVVPSYTSHSVDVLLGNADGTFHAPIGSDTGGLNAAAVAVADVNGDGALDALAVSSCADFRCETGTLNVLLGNADGTFQAAVSYDSGGNGPGSIAVGDVNGDTKPDVVMANFKADSFPLSGAASVAVLLNSSVGPTPARIDIRPGQFPNRVNPHSHALIRVALLATDTFDLTMLDPHTVRFGPAGAHPVGVRQNDVDGDGRLDVIYYFKTNKTGIACGDTTASLVGVIDEGQTFAGTDSVQTEGCHHATRTSQ
jgi:FG-GAP-like repeat